MSPAPRAAGQTSQNRAGLRQGGPRTQRGVQRPVLARRSAPFSSKGGEADADGPGAHLRGRPPRELGGGTRLHPQGEAGQAHAPGPWEGEAAGGGRNRRRQRRLGPGRRGRRAPGRRGALRPQGAAAGPPSPGPGAAPGRPSFPWPPCPPRRRDKAPTEDATTAFLLTVELPGPLPRKPVTSVAACR